MDGPTIQKTSDAFYGRIRGIIFSIRNKSVYRKEAAMPSKEKMADVIRKMFSITEDAASHEEIRERLLSGGKITGTNMVVMVCAIIIACVGLNTDSIAVIIGAMLISPLMGSILAMAYGTETGDGDLFRRHALGFAFQVVVSVATAVIYFLISPIKQPTAQIIARTQPTFFDVLVAVAGGVAGSTIGHGRSANTLGAIGGAAAGMLAGNMIQDSMMKQGGYEYIVRTDNGQTISVTQGTDVLLGAGQRCMLINGNPSRIIPY